MPITISRGPQRQRRMLQETQSNLSGGLNISADASQLLPNQVRRAENCRLTQYGGLLKRLGSRYLHAAAIGSGNPVRGGLGWEKDDATQQLIAISNGKVHYGSYGLPMTWTAVAAPTMSTTTYPSLVQFRDGTQEVVYIADGGKLLKWDGAVLARSLTSPNVSRVWVYNQRLYGCAGTDAILQVSGLNNGDDLGYTAGNGALIPIRTFGESSLVGGVALGASNLLFHRTGISRWVGVTQDDIAVAAGTLGLSSDIGTIVPSSIVVTETEVYFLSDRGFYAANAYGVRRISTNLDPDIFGLFTTATNLCATHNRYYREVVWYLPDCGFYAYNYQMQAWVGPWNVGYVSPITHSCWSGVNSSGVPVVFVGTASGFVKQMDYPSTYTDNVTSAGVAGSTITMTAQLRRMLFGSPASDKALRWAYVLAALNGSTNAALGWTTNTYAGQTTLTPTGGVVWDTPSMVWDAFVWGSGDAQEYRIPITGRGPYVDFTFVDSSTGATPPLLSEVRCEAFDYGEAHEYA